MNQDKLKRIDAVLADAIEKEHNAGASVMVFKDGKEEYYVNAGHADIAAAKPIKRDTIFRIYSMTKPVTSIAVMLLIERGLLDVQDPVSAYLPGFASQKVATKDGLVPLKQEMTINHLLGMTAGMPYPDDLNTLTGKEVDAVFNEVDSSLKIPGGGKITTYEFANKLGQCPLLFQPGEAYVYGTCTDIMAAIVEVISGKSYGEFLNDEFFGPLGMKDTAFYVPADKQPRLARTYEETASGLIEFTEPRLGIQNRMESPPAFESGGAGLASTIDDYMKFLKMLLGKGTLDGVQILSKAAFDYFTTARILKEPQLCKETLYGGPSGYRYGNFIDVLMEPTQMTAFGRAGELIGAGWLGTQFFISPLDGLIFLYMTQSVRISTKCYVRRLRNIVYSAL
ncbi:MAG: beta-lactamase family protein [Lachnospiraceae bacterium]|nr:beta-lactamase family protein [Lachnospiraceae bacterium]